eukprot:INCI8918.2.p1 GENE.INCI8918.2~~INCI8918.2.p1  ORF type:complete len:442 (-),score=73.93 INCI8918.2:1279-2604(-)
MLPLHQLLLLLAATLTAAAALASQVDQQASCVDGVSLWGQGHYGAALQILGQDTCVGELAAHIFHSPRQLSTFLQQQLQQTGAGGAGSESEANTSHGRHNSVLDQVTLWALLPVSKDGAYLPSLSNALRSARAAADAGDRVLPLAFCAAVAGWLDAASHLAASLPLVSSLEFCIAGPGQAPLPLGSRAVESACAALRVYLPPLPALSQASVDKQVGLGFERITAADVEQLEQLVHVLHAPLVWAVARAHGSAECVDAVLHVEVLLTQARSLLLRVAAAVATSLTAIEDDSEQTCVGTCKDGQPDTAEMDAVRRILDSDEVLDFAADLAQELFINGFIFSDLSEDTAGSEEYLWRQLNATLTGEPLALDCIAAVDDLHSSGRVVSCLTPNTRSNASVVAQTFQEAAGNFERQERFLLSALACYHPLSGIGEKVCPFRPSAVH